MEPPRTNCYVTFLQSVVVTQGMLHSSEMDALAGRVLHTRLCIIRLNLSIFFIRLYNAFAEAKFS